MLSSFILIFQYLTDVTFQNFTLREVAIPNTVAFVSVLYYPWATGAPLAFTINDTRLENIYEIGVEDPSIESPGLFDITGTPNLYVNRLHVNNFRAKSKRINIMCLNNKVFLSSSTGLIIKALMLEDPQM